MFGRTKNLIVGKGGDGTFAATSYMIAGRLELFPVLIMLSLATWRRK